MTDLLRKILEANPDLEKQWLSMIPTGQIGVPEDLKGPVVFLASDASKAVVGSGLVMDNGYTIV